MNITQGKGGREERYDSKKTIESRNGVEAMWQAVLGPTELATSLSKRGGRHPERKDQLMPTCPIRRPDETRRARAGKLSKRTGADPAPHSRPKDHRFAI